MKKLSTSIHFLACCIRKISFKAYLAVILSTTFIFAKAANVQVNITRVQPTVSLCNSPLVIDSFTITSDSLFSDTVLFTYPIGATNYTVSTGSTAFNTIISGQTLTITPKTPFSYAVNTAYSFRVTYTLPCTYAVFNNQIPDTFKVRVPSWCSYTIKNGSATASNTSYVIYTALLAPVLGSTVSSPLNVAINPNTTSSSGLPFKNSGTADFTGYLQLVNNTPCFSKIFKNIRIVDTSASPSVTLFATNTTINFPFSTTTPITIPSGHNFYVLMDVRDTLPCLVTACTAGFTLKWGCDTNKCNTSSPININYTIGNLVPKLNIVRLSPSPPNTSYQTKGWEGSCSGGNNAETQWDYVIQNTGGAVADSVKFVLNNFLHSSYTFIRKNSILVNDPSRISSFAGLTATTVSFSLTTTQLKADTFDFKLGTVIPHCVGDLVMGNDFPVDTATILIPHLGVGERVVISFRTFRCCPSDNAFNRPLFFNRWQRRLTAVFCNGTPVTIISNKNTISPFVSQAVVDDAGSNFNPISLEVIPKGTYVADLTLTQENMTTATDIAAPKNNCGSFETFLFQNKTYPSTNNNISEHDAMLYSSQLTALPVDLLQGANPFIRFHIKVSWQGNLQAPPTQYLQIVKGTTIWNPSNTVSTANSIEGDFDIDSLPLSIRSGSFYFRNFFIGSYINFRLKACCPTTNPNPKIIVQTSQDLRTSNTCTSCIVPLCSDTLGIFVHCPGCVTPGLITYEHHFWRNNFEYTDSNDNGLPDRQGVGSLVPITPSYSKMDLVNKNGSIVGDTILSTTSSYFVDGDNSGGFSYSTWQAYWTPLNGGVTPLLDHVYFQQMIANANSLGMNMVGQTNVTYKHLGVSTTIVLPSSQIISSASTTDKNFLFHIQASDFGTGTHFVPSDSFIVQTRYRSCTNPNKLVPVSITNAMMLSPVVFPSSVTDPWHSYALVPDYYHLRDSLGFHGASAISPNVSPPVMYLCEAFGGFHKVYPITVKSAESWKDNNSCSKGLSLTYSTRIGTSNDYNLFPYEYRLAPGLIASGLQYGMIIPNTSLLTFSVKGLSGYRIKPTISYSDFQPYVNITGLPVVRTQIPSSRIASPNYNNTDFTIDIFKTKFVPRFESTYTTINLTPPTAPTPYQTTPDTVLLLGDEMFSHTMEFEITPVCASVKDTTRLVDTSAVILSPVIYPGCANIQAANNNPNISFLVAPHPNLTAVVSPPVYVGNTITDTLNLKINGGSSFSNLVYYIEINQQDLPSGVSLQVNQKTPNVPLTPTIVADANNDTYWRFVVAPFNDTLADLRLTFTISSCDSVGNSPKNISVPIYYSWSCQSNNELDSILPIKTACSTPTQVFANYTLYPVGLNITSNSIASSTYKTCMPDTANICISNSGLGASGNITAKFVLPNNVPLTKVIVKQNATAAYVQVPNTAISSSTVGNLTTYTINLQAYSTFTLTSNGLNSVTSPFCLRFVFTPNCFMKDTFAPVCSLSIFRYCNLLDSNPVVLTQTFASILPHPTDPNGCVKASYTLGCDNKLTAAMSLGQAPPTLWVDGTQQANPYILSVTPNPHTVYIKDAQGCKSKDTIATYIQPLAIATPTIQARCGSTNNGAVSITVSGGNAPYTYQWSNAATSQNISGLAAGTYTVTVKDTRNCTGTATAIVGSGTYPDSTITVSIVPTCTGQTVTLTANASGTGITYSWNTSPVKTTKFITVNPPIDSTYRVTVSNGTCSASSSVFITGMPVQKIVGSAVGVPNLKLAITQGKMLPFSTAQTTPQNISVKGTFTIDTTYTLFRSTVVAGAGANIVLNSLYTLNASQTIFRGCDTLWKGIEMMPSAYSMFILPSTIRFDTCVILDAQYAINAGFKSNLYLRGNTFKNNYVGIHVPYYLTGRQVKFTVVTNNNFTSDFVSGTTPKDLKPNYTGMVVTGHQPVTRKPWSGMHVINNGVVITLSGNNNFSNLGNGLVMERADLSLSQFTMSNIKPVNYVVANSSLQYKNGNGVYATNQIIPPYAGVSNTPISFTVNGNGKNVTCMTNCKNGIWTEGMNTTINAVNMVGMDFGIRVANAKNCNVNVNNNFITTGASGIYLYQNDPVIASTVSYNTINLVPTGTSGSLGVGLNINYAGLGSVGMGYNQNYYNNIVNLGNGVYWGFQFNGLNRANVFQNKIFMNFPANNMSGIELSNCTDCGLNCNTVKGTNPYTANSSFLANGTSPTAFNIQLSNVNLVTNVMDSVFEGLVISDNCPNTNLISNIIGRHKVGLHYTSSAIIQSQIKTRNRWMGAYPFGNFAAKNDNFNSSILTNRLLVNAALGSIFWPGNSSFVILPNQSPVPTTPTVPATSVWFSYNSTQYTDTPNCNAVPYFTDTSTSGGGDVLAQRLSFEAPYQDAMVWKAESELYAKLKENPELAPEYSAEAAFVDAKDTETMGQFYSIEKDKAEALTPDVAARQAFEQGLYALDSIRKKIDQAHESYSLSTDPLEQVYLQTALENLENNYQNVIQQIEILKTAMESQRYSEIDLVKLNNQSIVPNERLLEINQKEVNNIYFNTIAKDKYEFDESQWQNLYTIANQCPIIGGRAVYQARALYAQYEFSAYNDHALCEAAGIFYRRAKENVKTDSSFTVKFYPNPNNGRMTVTISSDYEAQYQLAVSSVQGELLLNTPLGFYDGKARVSLGEINSGMYIVQLIRNGIPINTQKISVIK